MADAGDAAKIVVQPVGIGTDEVLGAMHADLTKIIGDRWPDVWQILECIQRAWPDAATS